MFGFTTPVGSDAALPLVNAAAVDNFWRLLPRFDPVRSQKAVGDALADFGIGEDPNVERLRALLALDRRARTLSDALLVNYAGQDPQARLVERRYWQAARELSQGFSKAYAQILRHLERDALPRAGRDFAPVFLLRLFQHRQTEFLLRPFESGYPDPNAWSELHEVYQYAHSLRLLTVPQEVRRSHDEAATETTIEREYLHLLLLDLMNDGHFSPYDAFWVNRWLPRACLDLTLKSVSAVRAGERGADHFVVDLDSAEGLVGVPTQGAVRCLFLDSSPLLESIDRDIAAIGIANEHEGATTIGSGARLKVLRKLRTVFSPRPPRVNRRGERKPVAVIVQAIVGFYNVVRMLRNESRRNALIDPSIVPEIEEITITAIGAPIDTPTTGGSIARSPVTSVAEPPLQHLMWEIRDRSESGCRLHGKVVDMIGAAPGTLVAVREHEMAPWILVVVRRRGKVQGDRVDIGVEYVGREPRRVISTTISDPDSDVTAMIGPERRFAVLYLPESGHQPTLPFKTLMMPSSEFQVNRCLVLRSAAMRYTVRLKEPIEEQGDFVWLPFDVIERSMIERAA